MVTTLHMFGDLPYAKGGEGVGLGQAKVIRSATTAWYALPCATVFFWSDGQPVVSGDFVYSWQETGERRL